MILGIAEHSQSCGERRDGQHSQPRPFYGFYLTRGYLETSRFATAKASRWKYKTTYKEEGVFQRRL